MKEKEIISKVRIYDYEELTDADRELIDKAKDATQTSYAPFSKFCVGAAARLSDGTIVTGSNQENAAFPSSLCAERTALFYANARYPEKSVEELAIAAYAHGTFLKSPSLLAELAGKSSLEWKNGTVAPYASCCSEKRALTWSTPSKPCSRCSLREKP